VIELVEGATETDEQTEEVWSAGFSRQGVQLCEEIENVHVC